MIISKGATRLNYMKLKVKQRNVERAKCLWTEKGERPTKYFEKRNCNRKVISELKDEDGKIIENEKQASLQKPFYV